MLNSAPFGKGASAPGKMLIAGEYVVLDGAPAIVTAVQRRATAVWVRAHDDRTAMGIEGESPRFPESAAARRRAETLLGEYFEGELAIDVSALRGEHIKLGVGSSAAAAAAAAAAVFEAAGRDLSCAEVKQAVLRCALEGHAEVAPRGSGVDVAASVLGETLHYRREPLHATPVPWPEGLITRVIWTAKAANTRVLLDQVAAFKERDPKAYQKTMTALRGAMATLCTAFFGGDVIASVACATEALRRLTKESGAPIVEETLERIAALAASCGGAAKPSGAGGGDIALAFFRNSDDGQMFDTKIESTDFARLDVELGGLGAAAI